MKEIKSHRISLRFFRHPRKRKKAKSAMKRLKTIAKTILRDLDRNFKDNQILHDKYAQKFYLFMRIYYPKEIKQFFQKFNSQESKIRQ